MPIDTTLTEQKIQRVLGGFIASPKYHVDGLFVFGWESDKLIWTKAGYIYEFEIKISRSDFKNDFKHKKEKHIVLASTIARDKAKEILMSLFEQKEKEYPNHWSRESLERYYGDIDAMAKGKRMPNYFYYAVPEGLLDADEVPPYAGLVYITTHKGGFEDQPDKWLHRIKIVRKAPHLHKAKYTDAELNLGEKFYYNMKTWQRNYREQVGYSLMYRQRLQHELDSKNQEKSYKQLQDELKDAEDKARSWEYEAKQYYGLYRTMVDGADLATIERRLMISEIKKHNPDFDYQTILEESDRIYKERYPNRNKSRKKEYDYERKTDF